MSEYHQHENGWFWDMMLSWDIRCISCHEVKGTVNVIGCSISVFPNAKLVIVKWTCPNYIPPQPYCNIPLNAKFPIRPIGNWIMLHVSDNLFTILPFWFGKMKTSDQSRAMNPSNYKYIPRLPKPTSKTTKPPCIHAVNTLPSTSGCHLTRHTPPPTSWSTMGARVFRVSQTKRCSS